MERPLVFDAFEDGNQFNNGVTLSNSYFDKKLQIWTGMFRTGTVPGLLVLVAVEQLSTNASAISQF